jgi:hypothetical protein
MVTHMKTTVEISDALLAEARDAAARDGKTVRALIEEGLRNVLASRKRSVKPFRLRDASFKGKGLQPGATGDWGSIAGTVYQGRGG